MKTPKGNSDKRDLKKDQEKDKKPLPGEYPPQEDIMNVNDMERVSVDPDTLSTSRKSSAEIRGEMESPDSSTDTRKADSDLSKEDYEALGPKDLSMDMGEDEALKHRPWPVDFSGKDLDVPGSELDDKNEAIGSEDEENNPYSLGGDDRENLEEDQTKTY